MKQKISPYALYLISVFIAYTVGYFIPKHSLPHSSSHHEVHSFYELEEYLPIPKIEMEIVKDTKSGINIRFITQNFQFTPEKSGHDNVPNEGHIHLYLNAQKVARVYSEWFHLDNIPEGQIQIKAVLTTNDHQIYTVDGKPIEAEVTYSSSSPAL